ncbi:MAG: LPS-assembly protein LptD, partial [Sphingopyxis sp.]|nr:LPS-assembly protein LptD [Sphingopyxis sp.]
MAKAQRRLHLRAPRPAMIALALAALGALTHAQDARAQAAQAQTGAPPAASSAESIGFAADTVSFDNAADIVRASGNVELEREAWRLRADQVEWNRATGRVVATGNVALTSPQGDIAYGDTVELTDTLR